MVLGVYRACDDSFPDGKNKSKMCGSRPYPNLLSQTRSLHYFPCISYLLESLMFCFRYLFNFIYYYKEILPLEDEYLQVEDMKYLLKHYKNAITP